MTFPYRPKLMKEAGAYFSQVASKILQKDFTIQKMPEPKICKECDIREYCRREEKILFNSATTLCTECLYDDEGWLCDDCAGTHGCDEEMFLPVVNSIRGGVCGYT